VALERGAGVRRPACAGVPALWCVPACPDRCCRTHVGDLATACLDRCCARLRLRPGVLRRPVALGGAGRNRCVDRAVGVLRRVAGAARCGFGAAVETALGARVDRRSLGRRGGVARPHPAGRLSVGSIGLRSDGHHGDPVGVRRGSGSRDFPHRAGRNPAHCPGDVVDNDAPTRRRPRGAGRRSHRYLRTSAPAR
jgi:hypothetical protein